MKRVVALLVLLVALAACGSKDITPKATGIPSTTAPSTTLPPVSFATSSTTTPEPAASEDDPNATQTTPETITSTTVAGG